MELRTVSSNQPDFIIIDLGPSDDDFKKVIETARLPWLITTTNVSVNSRNDKLYLDPNQNDYAARIADPYRKPCSDKSEMAHKKEEGLKLEKQKKIKELRWGPFF